MYLDLVTELKEEGHTHAGQLYAQIASFVTAELNTYNPSDKSEMFESSENSA